MRDYKLGDVIISTTEERYESTFKALGYEPVEIKESAKKGTKKNTKKDAKTDAKAVDNNTALDGEPVEIKENNEHQEEAK